MVAGDCEGRAISDKDYTEPFQNECGGYYCDERVGHIDCKTPLSSESPQGNAALFEEQRAEIARLQAELQQAETIRLDAMSEIDRFHTARIRDVESANETLAQTVGMLEIERARLIEQNVNLSQQVADLTAANELLQGDAVGEVCTPCDPIFDATDAACPCWQRGNDYAFAMLVAHVTAILDGRDDGSGANHEPWRTVRRRLLAMVAELADPHSDAVRLRRRLLPAINALDTIANDHGQQAGLIDQHWSVVLGWAQDIAKNALKADALLATAAQPDPLTLAIDRAHSSECKVKRDELQPRLLPSFAQDDAEATGSDAGAQSGAGEAEAGSNAAFDSESGNALKQARSDSDPFLRIQGFAELSPSGQACFRAIWDALFDEGCPFGKWKAGDLTAYLRKTYGELAESEARNLFATLRPQSPGEEG